MAFFGARAAIHSVLLTLLLIAPLPSGAEQLETPFAEVFSQLAARLVGVVVNISTTQATAAAPAKGTPDAQLPPGSPLDEFFRDFFGEKGAPGGPNPPAPRAASLGSGFIIDPSGIVVTNNHVIANAEGMANPIPIEPPEGEKIAVLMPMTSPARLNMGPPELPRLIEASVCKKSS